MTRETNEPSITPHEKIGGLEMINFGVARFARKYFEQLETDKDRALFAEFTSVLYYAMRDALDPDGKIELEDSEVQQHPL